MKRAGLRNLAASVNQRLHNEAKKRGEDFQLVLTRFAIERLLYRISRSPHADQFILKGALLFQLWGGGPYRATRDLDLLGRGANDIPRLAQIFRDLCAVKVEDDGIVFLPDTVRGEDIRQNQEYRGVRITLQARVAQARPDIQVDIGFGDVVTPSPQTVDFPTILDLPAPRLKAYPRETVIAEKFQAMVMLGVANSRMRDFYDVWILAKRFPFEGKVLGKAIRETFTRRKTPLPKTTPVAFTPEFYNHADKRKLWDAFLATRGAGEETGGLAEVAVAITEFLLPPTLAASAGKLFDLIWPPSGPWR